MSIFEDPDNQDSDIPEDEDVIDIPDIDVDIEDEEFPMVDEEELE